MTTKTSEVASITLVYSPDDGGWYGEVARGRTEHTTEVYRTRARAREVAIAIYERMWPDAPLVFLDDLGA